MKSAVFAGLPPHGRGQRIGLLGGSFNPPHEGHRAASLLALHRLRLDVVWWLVSPGNPLKNTRSLPSVAERLRTAATIAAHPRIKVTGVERQLGLSYTCDVVAALRRRSPTSYFVWVMGSDALDEFHRWKHWRLIAASVPLAIVDRPGTTLRAPRGRAAVTLSAARLPEHDAPLLPTQPPPAFVFLHGKRLPVSSTAIRAAHEKT